MGLENEKRAELVSFLKAVPSVEFCCVYGSTLHPNNKDKSAMVDYILGVSDPLQWHSQITQVADDIGVGVHFNPFVTWNDRMLKYGVVRMHDLVQDILNWETFYLSGRPYLYPTPPIPDLACPFARSKGGG
ncbi:phosphatidate cytidylyltransferase, mitochondrial-like [Mangifera indica]|uniref:phosphatidate cytidylyltransferase, mitochondrial-like n=1 Tax=Mangifera indica TaxID=29780 RepID=UPI001CFBEB6B|nr:phosphatidate cytidylyltransferase, mitochondrial-like [Mangifera indica]